jgi:hypothetical protein
MVANVRETRCALLLALLVFACTGTYSAHAQVADPSIAILISSPKSTWRSGESLRLDVIIENHTNQLLILGSSRSGRTGITIRDGDGNLIPPIDPGDAQVGSQFGLGVGPNKSAKESVEVDQLFNMAKPGTYRIQVQKRDPIRNETVWSNTLTITIAQ